MHKIGCLKKVHLSNLDNTLHLSHIKTQNYMCHPLQKLTIILLKVSQIHIKFTQVISVFKTVYIDYESIM